MEDEMGDYSRLRELTDNMKPPPWEQFSCKHPCVDRGLERQVFEQPETDPLCDRDDDFDNWVCEARNQIPNLLSEVRRLEAENERLRRLVEEARPLAQNVIGHYAPWGPSEIARDAKNWPAQAKEELKK